MKSQAAVLTESSTEWEIIEVDVDRPKRGEVLIRFIAAGLCHSDEHSRLGEFQPRRPIIGGHEGAGIVEAVGPDVDRVAVGDHVVCSFIPSCGRCRYCSTGHQNLCDLGRFMLVGCMLDETFRMHANGQDFGTVCMVGSFSQWGVVSQYSCVKVPSHLPLETAVLVGCGVPTGWGAAVNTGKVGPGDTVAVYGVGGIGINAVQGARLAGARHVIAVDPIAMKREFALSLGATHAFATATEAAEFIVEVTWGQGTDCGIVTTGIVQSELVRTAFDSLGKAGVLVVVGLSAMESVNIQVPGFFLVNWEKQIRGSSFGSSNPQRDILHLLDLYEDGQLELDRLITNRYRLADIRQGYDDMYSGKNIRGVIIHEH
jgi:NDMA-dependent alcohol dehydrogenase